MPISDQDLARLSDALTLAQQAIGLSEPNPRVGCVIAAADGRILGRGHTQAAGDDHAEAMTLRELRSAGHDARGGTAWVSLEPCAHQGRTPPCCDALVAAGLARVVVALADPNPLVAGQGIARMRAAGVQVDVADGDADTGTARAAEAEVVAAAREINIGFLSRMQRKRPWLRLKIAASLDGRTALHDGTSQWITAEAARTDGHAFRRRASAVLSGIGTVLEDDPRLDVRLVSTARQPLRVIVDSQLKTPPRARVLAPPGEVLIYAAGTNESAEARLCSAGATVCHLPSNHAPGVAAKVDLAAMLADLARRGINELHVEAGHKLNGSLLREGLVDELLIYLAPMLIGPGREMAALGPLRQLADAQRFKFTQVDRIGDDLRILARPAAKPPA